MSCGAGKKQLLCRGPSHDYSWVGSLVSIVQVVSEKKRFEKIFP
jgi:hypothetical protein